MTDEALTLPPDLMPTVAEEARERAMRRAIAHSRRVAVLKRTLPVIAVALLAGLGGAAWLARSGPVEIDTVAIENGRIVMQNPRLTGLTRDNRPYSVTAERAFQSVSNADDIALEAITADVPFGTAATGQLTAAKGHLDNASKTLKLDGGFTFVSSDGMTATFEAATLDIADGGLVTKRPVTIRNASTDITAGALKISDDGAILLFENKVRLVLTPDALRKTPVEAPAKTSEPSPADAPQPTGSP
ncbi:MAG: LPS export ABC transporter periplasmic protein LptC [Rhizobiaceae bacterium]|jgi:lipopolysaccharide export system protein LptC|nr:LPS export ABC transporter periplasmic protein LptC [Rhizobiaceae bacterium]